MRLREVIGINIRLYRKKHGMSQWDLANKAGFSRQTICNIERGSVNVGIDTIEGLAVSMNMNPCSLLRMEDPEVYISLLLRSSGTSLNKPGL